MAQRGKALFLVSRSAIDVSTRERSSLFLPMNCWPILEHTKKRSVYITGTFRSCGSLKRFGKHHTVSQGNKFPRTKNHINGFEGFWSLAKHVLPNYRVVSKYLFPMSFKEVECRLHRRSENLLQLFTKIYFGDVST